MERGVQLVANERVRTPDRLGRGNRQQGLGSARPARSDAVNEANDSYQAGIGTTLPGRETQESRGFYPNRVHPIREIGWRSLCLLYLALGKR